MNEQQNVNLKCKHCQKTIGKKHIFTKQPNTIVALNKSVITKVKTNYSKIHAASYHEESVHIFEILVQIRCAFCSKHTTFPTVKTNE